jgi:hypothetical protein
MLVVLVKVLVVPVVLLAQAAVSVENSGADYAFVICYLMQNNCFADSCQFRCNCGDSHNCGKFSLLYCQIPLEKGNLAPFWHIIR